MKAFCDNDKTAELFRAGCAKATREKIMAEKKMAAESKRNSSDLFYLFDDTTTPF